MNIFSLYSLIFCKVKNLFIFATNMSKIPTLHCAVEDCKITSQNKPAGVLLHTCPTNKEMRNRWMRALKNKCYMLDWATSRICSKHFDSKYFDSQRRLSDTATPTLFGSAAKGDMSQRSKVERLLSRLTQAELTTDVKNSLARMKEPSNLDVFVNDDLRCKPDAPMEAKLWLMVKKQENLNARLLELVVQTKKHVEILQNKKDDSSSVKREQEQNMESLKYIVKCLQEKHATLEEQIEILTAVESR